MIFFPPRGRELPLTLLFVEALRRPELCFCRMENLRLELEHPSLGIAVSSATHIHTARLINCQTRNAAQLGRFLISLPSLVNLRLESWSPSQSELVDTHVRRRWSKSSLRRLHLRLTPNIHALLDYFILAYPFVTHLSQLALDWDYVSDADTRSSFFLGIDELLQHCR